MTEQEVKIRLKDSDKTWEEFLDWMIGQTVGMNEDGSTNWYEYDVDRFMRGRSPMSHG